MQRWRRLIRRFVQLPLLMRVGVALLFIGGAGDLLSHGLRALAPMGYPLHLLTFIGMAVTLLGLVIDLIRSKERERS